MGLNHLMHPRNIYKDRPPDFRVLAEKYPDFRRFATFSSTGKVRLDFFNPEAVRCLTEKLLKEDFNLDVILPSNALVPRIPQRLNYLLLLEDLMIASKLTNYVIGIDIGTGPSCVYPLLGADHFGWKFCATEINDESFAVAQKNVRNNSLDNKIVVLRGHELSIFREVLNSNSDITFTFSMCNPPFFDQEECEQRFQPAEDADLRNSPGGQSATTKLRRPGPLSATIAKSSELWVRGGEIAFVSRMIQESQIYKYRVKLFTSMVGKKKSLSPLKKLLDDMKFALFTSHPISQGKTQRWILVWTFDPTVRISTNLHRRQITIKSTDDPLNYFCRICQWAKAEVRKHSNDILTLYIPAHALYFRPWKAKSSHDSLDDMEPKDKRFKSMLVDASTQTEFNNDLDCGSLCLDGKMEMVERSGDNDLAIQCCLSPDRPVYLRNFRLIVSRAASCAEAALEAEFLTSDETGYRWMESIVSFVHDHAIRV